MDSGIHTTHMLGPVQIQKIQTLKMVSFDKGITATGKKNIIPETKRPKLVATRKARQNARQLAPFLRTTWGWTVFILY